jgi:hypothetical protein
VAPAEALLGGPLRVDLWNGSVSHALFLGPNGHDSSLHTPWVVAPAASRLDGGVA